MNTRLHTWGAWEADIEPDPRQLLADLIAYTERARTPGRPEYDRVRAQPYAVVLTVERYARDVLDLLGAPGPGE